MGPLTFTDLKKQWKHQWLLPELFWAMLIYVKSWMPLTHADISLHKSIKPPVHSLRTFTHPETTKKKCMMTQFCSHSYQTMNFWLVMRCCALKRQNGLLGLFLTGRVALQRCHTNEGERGSKLFMEKKDGCDLDMLLTSLKWNTMKFSPEPTASGLFVKILKGNGVLNKTI